MKRKRLGEVLREREFIGISPKAIRAIEKEIELARGKRSPRPAARKK